MSADDRRFLRVLLDALAAARARLPADPPAREVAAACRKLLRLSPPHRRLWVRNSSKPLSGAVCRWLLRQSHDQRDRDPAEMLRLAEAAVLAGDALPGGSLAPPGPPVEGSLPALLAADLRAEAWAALANALRVANRAPEAEHAWKEAEVHRAQGSDDPLLHAHLLQLRASLRIDQRRPRQAAAFLRRARELYSALGERHLEGRSLIKLARAERYRGRMAAANEAVAAALARLEGGRDPLAKLMAFHNVIHYLGDTGQHYPAYLLLRRAAPLYRESAGPLLKIRRLWLEGRLCAGLGWYWAAEHALDRARRAFRSLGLPFDAALAALDLAHVFARQKRWGDAEWLAHEMAPVFFGQGVPEEAQATLRLFSQAAQARTATAAAITRHLTHLRHLQTRRG